MRKYFSKWNIALGSALVFALTAVPAFAAAGDPPTFDANTLKAPLNDYGTALLAGLVILIGVVLVIRVPFNLVNLGMKAAKRLFGGAKPNVG